MRAQGRDYVNLVDGNLTRQGCVFPIDLLTSVLAEAAKPTLRYAPHPLGQLAAREAVANWYGRQGVQVPAEQILLTPGTSLAYAYAFQLLADPGDEILCPTPNYPLFESIAAQSGVRLTSYALKERDGWRMDLASLAAAITPKTRAIVVISPHNPTGMVASTAELTEIGRLARRRDLALVVDEVFSPFVFSGESPPRSIGGAAPLVLTLNGFSKMLALPGLKLGWMAVTGDAEAVRQALRVLDGLSDTYLPVSEVVQAAVPRLLMESGPFQDELRRLVAERRHQWERGLTRAGVPVLGAEGGFYSMIRLPGGADEEALCVRLLRDHRLLVHPGYFYDAPEGHLVFSHVSEPRHAATLAKALLGG